MSRTPRRPARPTYTLSVEDVYEDVLPGDEAEDVIPLAYAGDGCSFSLISDRSRRVFALSEGRPGYVVCCDARTGAVLGEFLKTSLLDRREDNEASRTGR